MDLCDPTPWAWACSVSAMAWLMLYGMRSRLGPPVALASQGFWVGFIWASGETGLWPVTAMFTVQHAMNWWQWTKGTRRGRDRIG